MIEYQHQVGGYKSNDTATINDERRESVCNIYSINISLGSYERYRDRGADGAILSGEALRQYVRGKVDQSAKWQRDHYDIWYKVLAPEFKERLYRAVPVTDAFEVKDVTELQTGVTKEYFDDVILFQI